MRKLTLRQVKWLTQAHAIHRCQKWELNPGLQVLIHSVYHPFLRKLQQTGRPGSQPWRGGWLHGHWAVTVAGDGCRWWRSWECGSFLVVFLPPSCCSPLSASGAPQTVSPWELGITPISHRGLLVAFILYQSQYMNVILLWSSQQPWDLARQDC